MKPYVGAHCMILGHGAGMIHALWLKPNATVIEVGNSKDLSYNYLTRISHVRQLHHIRGDKMHFIFRFLSSILISLPAYTLFPNINTTDNPIYLPFFFSIVQSINYIPVTCADLEDVSSPASTCGRQLLHVVQQACA
jgi:hypothetical protein